MVTVPAGLVIDLNATDDGTTAIGFRRALATIFKGAVPGQPNPGRLGSDHLAVTGNPGAMSYNVSSGGILLVRSATGGAYLVGIPTGQVIPTGSSDAANPRIDRIYVLQPDPAIDGPAVGVDFIIDVVSGVAGATPEVPALPSGAYEIARKLIAAGATNTTSGAAFTDVAPVTGLSVGVVPVAEGGTGANTKAQARANLGITSGTAVPSGAFGDDGDIYFQVI